MLFSGPVIPHEFWIVEAGWRIIIGSVWRCVITNTRGRDRDRERESERDRKRERDRERKRKWEWQKARGRQREKENETEREKEREKERHTDREREKEKERQKHFILFFLICCLHWRVRKSPTIPTPKAVKQLQLCRKIWKIPNYKRWCTWKIPSCNTSGQWTSTLSQRRGRAPQPSIT